jgi:hypothetical protein
MVTNANAMPNLYALLIGIDCYLPNRLPNGIYYPSLAGCVRDITLVEEFLRRKLGIPEEHILKLKASNTGAAEPPEPREEWPTDLSPARHTSPKPVMLARFISLLM